MEFGALEDVDSAAKSDVVQCDPLFLLCFVIRLHSTMPSQLHPQPGSSRPNVRQLRYPPILLAHQSHDPREITPERVSSILMVRWNVLR